MSEKSDSELISMLRKNGFKVTPQRLAICKYILASKEHPTAEEILNTVRKEYPSISHATVYKTIQLLKDLGLIVELSFQNEHAHFDSNVSVHVNIVCPKCGKIVDYISESVDEFSKKLETEVGGPIAGQRFDIYKICKNCK